jgi:hypothetical protein
LENLILCLKKALLVIVGQGFFLVSDNEFGQVLSLFRVFDRIIEREMGFRLSFDTMMEKEMV